MYVRAYMISDACMHRKQSREPKLIAMPVISVVAVHTGSLI